MVINHKAKERTMNKVKYDDVTGRRQIIEHHVDLFYLLNVHRTVLLSTTYIDKLYQGG
jgi:hypothetical protein